MAFRRKGQTSSSIVHDLGIYLDSSLTMTAHISRTVSNCFAALRQVRSVRRSLPMRVMSSLVTALVLTRLDCGNASLARLPTCQLNPLQSVLHAAGRLDCGARNYDYVTPLLEEFHWLSVPDRITLKLATLVFRCMHGLAQAYLAETEQCSRRRLAAKPELRIVKSANGPDDSSPHSR